MNRKKIYRVVGGFLASITFITSVLPTFAFDRLPKEYNGQNPYVITEEHPLSPEEMDALLNELSKEYKQDELPEIEALPDNSYVLLCENNGKKESSGIIRKNIRRVNTPRNLSEEISVDSNVMFVPSVSKSGRMYTFDSLSVKENVSNHENLKSVSLFLEGENYVKETSDISDTGLWSIDNISFSFEEEKPYRFLIEYTYETEVIDTPTVSGSDISENNSQGSNDQSVNGSVEVSGNDTQTPPAGGNDVSDNNGPVGTSDTTPTGGDNSHLERTTKKAYSPAFIIHKVKTGESLRSLASDMGVEASTIKKDNGLSIFFAKKGSTLFINGPKADFVPPFDFSDEAIETFQKLGAKKGSEFAYDAVNLSTLNLLYEEEDINIKEQDTFSLTRYFYSGLSGYKGVFGYGISSIFDERVVDISDDKKLVVLQDMRGILLLGENGTFVSSDGQYTLKENEEDYSLTDLSLNYKNFNKAGYITSVGGKKGELYSLIYDDNGNLRKIKTRAEKEFGISLNRNGFIDEISNPDGTKKTYEYDEKGQLVKVTNERGFNRLYEYDANRRLLNAKNPMGKASIIVSYGDDGLINSYTDGEGNTSVFTKNGEYTSFTDAKGAVTKYWFDNADRNIKTLYPGDKTEEKTFDDRGNILSETDRSGEASTYVYDAKDHLLSESGKTGVKVSYTYDEKGNLLTETDANGNVTKYEYDDKCNPVLITYPNGSKTQMEFDDKGRMTKVSQGESVTSYEYNGSSYNIAKVTDSMGNVTENTYDAMDRLLKTKEGTKVTSYEYNETGKLVKETSPDGKVDSYEYDAADQSIGITDPSGNKVGMRYDSMGRIVQVINADGSHTDFAYDANGNMISEKSSTGVTKTYTYNENDEMVEETSSAGESISYTRDSLGRITKETYKDGTEVTYEYHPDLNLLTKKKDELGREISYEYDKVGNLLKESYSNGTIVVYTYDSMNRKTSILDEKGIKTEYTYNDNGNILKEVKSKNGKSLEKTYEYDSNYNLIKETDADGISVYYEYDSLNRLAKVTDGEGYISSYTYGAGGETLTETDRNGNTKSYSYDGCGNMVKVIDPEGNVTSYTYDSEGRVVTTTMPDGSVTGVVYNENGYMSKKVDPYGNIEEYTYDDNGNVLSVKSPDGGISTYTYDWRDNKLTETMPNGRVTKYAYNKLNWLTKITYDNDTYAVYSYDYNGKVVKVTMSNGQEENYEYDQSGNLLTHKDAAGIITKYTYDDFGLITSVETSTGSKEIYTYTKGGKSLTKTDELGRVINYEYDKRGSLKKAVDSFGTESYFEYDGNGNITKIVEIDKTKETMSSDVSGNITVSGNEDVSGNASSTVSGNTIVSPIYDEAASNVRITKMAYDKNNNLIATTTPDGETERQTYDFNGKVLTATDKNGNTTKNTYDGLGRLLKTEAPTGDITSYGYTASGYPSYVKDPLGNITSYVYDQMANCIETTLPNGSKTTYTYDKQCNLLSETNALSQTVNYEYDKDGNLIKKTYPNGIFEKYEYDSYGRTKSVTDVHGLKTSYEYDLNGNTTKVITEVASHKYTESTDTEDVSANLTVSSNENDPPETLKTITTSYTYDSLNRLIKQETEGMPATEYEYDKYGNVCRQVNGKNEELSKTDVRGNLLWSKSSSGIETTYKYDKADKPIEVISGKKIIKFTYDKAGNVIKTESPDGSIILTSYDSLGRKVTETDALGNVTEYAYDANSNVSSIKDALGKKSSYEYDNVGNLIKEISVDGSVTTYGYDAIGQLVKVKDPDGTSAFYTYDSMGNLIKETISTEEDYYAPVTGEHSRREAVYEYEKTGEIRSQGGGGLNREYYTYYKDGTLEEIKYPSGKKTGYEYDEFGRNTAVFHAGKKTAESYYNDLGQLIKTKDETGITEFAYDDLGNIIKAKSPSGTVSYSYDIYGNKETITYPDGSKAKYEYDIMNRILSVTDKSGIKTSFVYDAVGNVLSESRSDGISTETTYDALYRKTKVTTKKNNSEIASFEYSFDKAGRVSSEKSKDSGGMLYKSYEYDTAGKLIKYAETKNKEYYDNGFKILRPIDVSNNDVSGSDVSGNANSNGPVGTAATIPLASVSGNDKTVPASLDELLKTVRDIKVITYEYDTFSNRTVEEVYDNGAKTKSEYVYDTENRLEKKEVNGKTQEKYTYDKDGNLTSIVKPGATKTFTYNADNKLTETRINGNLVESSTYNSMGLKVSSSLKKEYNVTVSEIKTEKSQTQGKSKRYSSTYEEDNSFVEKETHIIPGKDGYEYKEYLGEIKDEKMQWLADFIGMFAPAFSNGWHEYADSLTVKEYQTVTVEGRDYFEESKDIPHEKTVSGSDTYVKRTPATSTEKKTEESHTETEVYYENSLFVYDVTLSNPQVLAEESAPGAARVSYTYAGEERLSSSVLGTYVYDGRGSVKKVVNAGTIVRDYEYDPYGNIVKGAPTQDRMFGYNGEEYTPQSGLIYLRARHYNPSTATFTSKDTYAGSKTSPVTRNRYSFANNNPIMYQDPSGHAGLLSKVVSAVKSIPTVAKKVVSKVANSSVVKNVSAKITSAVQSIKTETKKIVNNVKTAVSTVKTVISNAPSTIKKGVQVITNKVQNVVNQAKVAISDATTQFVNKAKNVATSVVSYVRNDIPNAISNFVSNTVPSFCNSIKNYVSDKVETVKAKVSTMWEEVKDSAHKLMARGEAFVQEKYESASRWWQDTKEKASRVVDRAKNFVEDMSCSIKEGLHEASEKIKDTFDKAVEGAKSAWNSFTTFVSEHKEAFIKIGACLAVIGTLALFAATGGAAAPLLLLMAKGAAIGLGSFFVGGMLAEGIDYLSGDRSNKEGLFGRMVDRGANWGMVGTGAGAAVGALVYSATALPSLLKPAATAAPATAKAIDELSQNAGKIANTVEKASSRILRKNMILEKIQDVPLFRNAAHHIVAGSETYESAALSREILSKFGIGINDAVNGVFLPIVKGVSDAAYHPSLHTDKYYDWVLDVLSNAQTREEVIAMLRYIADCLSNGGYIK